MCLKSTTVREILARIAGTGAPIPGGRTSEEVRTLEGDEPVAVGAQVANDEHVWGGLPRVLTSDRTRRRVSAQHLRQHLQSALVALH